MRLILLMAGIFLFNLSFAQVVDQDKMNYQAVILNASNRIVINGNVGVKVSILQNSVNGTAAYIETHTGTTNENGLLTLEIGGGTVLLGQYDSIDWAAGPYFLKTETDPEGGNNFVISGTQKLMSVPFALYAKSTNEKDPFFSNSVAAAITAIDTAYWNNKLDTFIESDPIFDASVAAGITGTDTTRWNNKQNKLFSEPGFFISDDTLKMSQKHYVGEHFGGGVICYVTPDGEHGIIMAYEDLPGGKSYQFSNITTEAALTSLIDGFYSTNQIINQVGHTASAAQACADWTNTDYAGTGSYDDWYLPSIDEILPIRFNEHFILKEAILNDNADETTWFEYGRNYWTSSEVSTSGGGTEYAFSYTVSNWYFYEEDQVERKSKSILYNVRCVRRF